ncbi:hypothetical protein [Marinibacterium profundimaris]|uniref:hypothetical protein n=1 Tax=Marinibacterium profundimaris TaxID=1679460 RepID=UPI000B5231B4|nr:hypothetical protein [Marinibacterium profundimaris]
MASINDRPDDDRLLDYVSGRLPAAEAAQIETAAGDPDLAADIALMRGMRAALRDGTEREAPGELGWKRLERAMDAAGPQRAPLPRRTPLWQVAAVTAVAAVLGWQFVALPMLGGPQAGYGTVSEAPAEAHSLTLAFAPQATEAEIRALLAEAGGRITDGPSALGLWQVSFDDAGARDAALAAFGAVPGIVEHVQAN